MRPDPYAILTTVMADDVGEFLSSKLGEYRILTSPLERVARDLDYHHQLLRSKIESEIAAEVPTLGALAEILDISILEMLLAPDRYQFVSNALARANMSSQDVLHQLRTIGAPPRRDEMEALGLAS